MLRRAHPANGRSWLHVERQDYSAAFEQQQRMVKAAHAGDPSFSGQPEGFSKWADDQITGVAAADPSIARQISERIAKLESDLSKAEVERQRQAKAAQAREAALSAEIEQLINLLPMP